MIVRRGHELDRVLGALDRSLRWCVSLVQSSSTVRVGQLSAWRRRSPERALHQHGVEPAAVLEADRLRSVPIVAEAARCMQRRSSAVCAESPITAIICRKPRCCRGRDQRVEQQRADAAAVHVGRDIDRILDASNR